jgi:hypothetical protein
MKIHIVSDTDHELVTIQANDFIGKLTTLPKSVDLTITTLKKPLKLEHAGFYGRTIAAASVGGETYALYTITIKYFI